MTSEVDNSSTDAATPSRKRLLKGYQNPQEQERRMRAQQRLKEVYSSIPWYKEQAEKDGEIFWKRLHDKAPLSD
jgi:hypothetical protein